jgi:hypothetical protein
VTVFRIVKPLGDMNFWVVLRLEVKWKTMMVTVEDLCISNGMEKYLEQGCGSRLSSMFARVIVFSKLLM